ncbi:hypothetical protein EU537_05790 [Candidatus Thorarchaeota archaeon]|nr:MAG: hypothetical protein EU537_05790 [Candidatus Thorarchaeota archaeon]
MESEGKERGCVVEEHAPILHFHPREGEFCCYPSDAEEVYSKFHQRWDEFNRDVSPSQLNQATPCYYELWQDESMTQIRYWIWYNYNRFPGAPFGLGDHIGDWEHVEVRIYHKQHRGTLWLLSNHLDYRLAAIPEGFTLPQRKSRTPILDKNHIHVWSALGSHAHYTSPDSEPRCYARILCDKVKDGGEIWNTWHTLKPLGKTNFHTFTGRWGNSGSPRSPSNPYNNRWRNAPNLVPEYTE